MPNEFSQYAHKLLKLGYEPVPIPLGGKGPKGQASIGWQKNKITPARIDTWAEEYPTAGVGIRSHRTPGIDLDVYDKSVSELLYDWCHYKLNGATIGRIGQAPKILVPCRATASASKRYSKSYTDSEGRVNRIEILRKGQQFVTYHQHPDTQKPYRYDTENTFVNTPRKELPVLTEELIDELFGYFDSIVPDDWMKTGKQSTKPTNGHDDSYSHLVPRLDITMVQARKVLKSLPYYDVDDHKRWLNVGMAVHHQFGGKPLAMKLWAMWSKQSDKYDPKALQQRWRSFGNGDGPPVTFATVLKYAKEAQVQVAKAKVEGPKPPPRESRNLTGFLKRYAFMPEGNSVVDLKRPVDQAVIKIESFRNLTANCRMDVNSPTAADPDRTKLEPIHKFWLTDKDRMTIEGTTYDPGTDKRITRKNRRLFLNLAHFPQHAKILKKMQDKGETRSLKVFADHMQYLFPIKSEREWFEQWLAWNVQRPAQRCKVTPLHVSKAHRTGRGWVVELLEHLLGNWNVSKAKMAHLCGGSGMSQFDDYLHQSLVCAIEEVKESDKRYAVNDQIRDILTENRLNVNLKYGGKGTIDVHTNMFLMTNHSDGLIIPMEDERIYVLSGASHRQSTKYYDKLYNWAHNKKNIAALWGYLQSVDLSNFNWQVAPDTPARAKMIDYNLTTTEAVFLQWMEENKYKALSRQAIDLQLNQLADRDGHCELIESKQVNKLLQQHSEKLKQVRLKDGSRIRAWGFGGCRGFGTKQIRKQLRKSSPDTLD